MRTGSSCVWLLVISRNHVAVAPVFELIVPIFPSGTQLFCFLFISATSLSALLSDNFSSLVCPSFVLPVVCSFRRPLLLSLPFVFSISFLRYVCLSFSDPSLLSFRCFHSTFFLPSYFICLPVLSFALAVLLLAFLLSFLCLSVLPQNTGGFPMR